MPNAVVLRAVLTGTSAGQVRAFNEAASAAEMSSAKIVHAGTHGAEEFSSAFEKHTSLVGGSFGRLSKVGSTFGLPFSESLDKIALKLDVAKAKGEGFGATMSAIGGLALGVGIAGFIAFGAESIHVADQVEAAMARLKTATKNAGVQFEEFEPFVNKAEASMRKLGFTDAETIASLAKFTTATGSPAAALTELARAGNLARGSGVDLGAATDKLTKFLAGNTRGIASLGLNLDLVSGKLHSVKTAQDNVSKASQHLSNVQADIAAGSIKGARAANQLAEAHAAVASAQAKYKAAAEAIPKVMAEIDRKFKDAGKTFSETFPGQLQTARAELLHVASVFGEDLVGAIQHGEVELAGIVKWFGKNEVAAQTLGFTIGTFLVAAIGTFAVKATASLVTGVAKSVASLFGLGTAAETTASETVVAAAAIETSATTIEASFAALVAAIEANTLAIGGALGGMAAEVSTADGLIVIENAKAAQSFTAIPIVASEAAAELAVVEAAVVAETEAAAVGVGAALGMGTGGIGFALIGLAVGVELLATHWHDVWADIKNWTADGANFITDKLNHIPGVNIGRVGMSGGSSSTPAGDPYQGKYGPGPAAIVDPFGSIVSHPIDPRTTTSGSDLAYSRAHGGAKSAGQIAKEYEDALANIQGKGNKGISPHTGAGVPHIGVPGSGTSGLSKKQRDALERAAAVVDNPLIASTKGPTDILGQGPTVKALLAELTPVHHKALEAMVARLNATHNVAMEKLATKLESDWKGAQDKLQGIVDADLNAGQSELAKLQGAITSDSMNGLKGAVSGIAATKFEQLISALVGVHTTAGDEMVKQLRTEFKTAQDQLRSDILTDGIKAKADLLKVHTDALADQTKAIQDAARAQSQAITDAASVMSSSMQAAAQAIGDASRVISDKASAQAQAIEDATNTAHDEAMARAQAIQDASQIVVDTIGQRGLYGLNLVAQQQTVALDKMKQGFDQQVAAAQHSIDLVTANNHATIAQAQQALDAAVQIQNSLVGQAQSHAAQVAQQSNAVIAGSLAALDQTQAHANKVIATAAAQNAWTQAHGSASQKSRDSALLTLAQAQQAAIVGQAEAAQSAAENAAAQANAQASAALQAAQDQANSVKAAADAALAAAQGNAAIVIAQAQQALSQASDQAAVAEAQQQAEIAKTRADASTQFAGGGLTVNITGLPTNDASAIASELSWITRTLVSNAG